MATIDNLNFKVIIDDKDFNAKIKQMEEAAKKFNASMSRLLDVNKAAEQWSQKDVENNRRAWQAKVDEARAQEKINQAKIKTDGLQRKINAQIDRATRGYQSQSRILGELKGLALGYLSIHGASQLLSSLVRVTGEFELQRTTLAAMLGDLNAAEQVITRIQGLAVESPFQFKELTTYAKQLSAFSVPAQELYDTTKMLADISAGLGVGMDRIVLAYGQVRSAAFLRGQEVRQFTEAGIPILDELAKQFSELEGRAVSTGEVFDKISARLVPFEMVAKVFKDMTAEGGKFYNMQEIQAETLRGKISNLKDAYEVMLNEIGSAHSDKLKGAVDGVRNLMQNWEKIGGQLVDLIKLFGAYKVAVGVLGISDTIAKFGGLAKAIQSTAVAQRLMNSALMTNPYIAVATAITAVALAINRHRKSLGDTTAAQNAYNKRVKELERIDRERTNAIRNLIDVIQDETRATIERESALMSLKDAYPDIFAQYDIESLKLADILNIKKQIAEEDAKQRKVEAYGSIGAQEGRIKALIARGASDNHIEAATAVLREMQKGYLEKYVLPNMVSELRGMTDDALSKALQEAYRKSQYDTRGIEYFDNIPTTQSFYEDLYEAIQSEIKRRQSASPVEGWRKKVQDTLTELGLDEGTSFGLWAKDTTQSTEYVEDLIKRYKELNEQIKLVSSFDEEQAKRLQSNKEAIEAVSKALNIDINALTAERGTNKKSKAQLELESQIDLVKKLQDAYEKLLPFLNDSQMKDTLKNLFPEAKAEWLDSFDFSEVLKKLADDLDKYDEEAAKRLRASVGKDVASSLASAFMEIETYKKMLDEWFGQDFNLEGEGISFDISKIVHDLNNQYAKVDQKRLKAQELLKKAQLGDEESLKIVRMIYGEEVWKKYITDGESAIDELARKEKESARNIANEKIRDLADKYVKERTKNLDLEDWGDKSLQQIFKIRDEVEKLQSEEIVFDDSLIAQLNEAGLSLEEFIKLVKEGFKEIDEETEEEEEKAIIKRVEKISESISSLGGEIVSLGDAIGNSNLSTLGKELSDNAEAASKLIEAIKAKDTLSIITNVLALMVSKITTVITANYEYQRMLNEAALEYRDIMLDIRREAFSGIFGTDEMALAAENQRILTESLADYADSLKAFEDDKKLRNQKFFGNRLEFKKMSVSDVVENIADASGWDLYRENGELNMDALIAYYDSYAQHLTKGQKGVVDALISSYQAQNDAAAQSAEYMKSIFSSAADSIANDMVAAFIESGDAAIDMRSIVSDVASDMASDLIKALYIMPTLNDYAQQLNDITANDKLSADEKTVKALEIFQTAVSEIEGNKDAINETLQKLDEFFLHPEEGEETVGAGIKGMTEDTANLLASYLNAIRADVSYSKELWQKMDANTQAIANALVGFSAPTLLDYQKRIEANTYNNMLATQEILAELRGVVTSESGATSIRVYREN